MDRKEYAQFAPDKKPDPEEIHDLGVLRLNGYQNFIKHFMSINTRYDRILLMHSTGVGKTITSLSTAIDHMRSIGGNVFIMGFSKSVFKRELMTRPEFGYVTHEEVKTIKTIRSNILEYNRPEDVSKLRDMKRSLSMRMRGNVSFVGYKALPYRMFVKISGRANMEAIKNMSDLQMMLSKKWIKPNMEFFQRLDLAFIICDEVHNLYNSSSINSWGVCLKYLMDTVNCKAMLLSATPVNHRPEKIVSILNLLDKDTVKNSDLFKEGELTPAGEAIIREKVKDKVSYIMDRDVSKFPGKEFVGSPMGFLKFVKCRASSEQESKVLEVMHKGDIDTETFEEEDLEIAKSSGIVPLEGKFRYLNDMYLPDDAIKSEDSYEGDFLLRDNIGKYSAKYSKLLDILEDIVRKKKGKAFVYHNFVSGTGVSLIKNLLEKNGFSKFGNMPNAETRCSKCFERKKSHDDNACGAYSPLMFIYATGGVSKHELEYNFDVFNSKDNTHGDIIKIVLGSQAIKESYDFKAIRNVIVAYMPDNMSTLIQVLGRAIRKNSHAELPMDERMVQIHLLVTELATKESFEILKYQFKMAIFERVRKINQILADSAIDRDLNYDINYPGETEDNILYDPPRVGRNPIDFSNLKKITANAFYINEEVTLCQFIIKKLMVDKYPVPVTYDEIVSYVKDPPFGVHRNTKLIEEISIVAAIEYLSTRKGPNEFNKLDLFRPNRNIPVDGNVMFLKMLPSGKYVLATTQSQDRLEDLDFYRPKEDAKPQTINLNSLVNGEEGQVFRLQSLIQSLKNKPIEAVSSIVQTAEPELNRNAIHLVIEYFNDMWLRTEEWQRHTHHDTLVKLLFVYNKFGLVIFASSMDAATEKEYLDKFGGVIEITKVTMYTSSDSHYQDYRNLMNSTAASERMEEEDIDIKFYNYHKHAHKFDPKYAKKDKYIPIGHYFDMDVKILNANRTWVKGTGFNKLTKIKKVLKDNKDIIGFLTKDKAGLSVTFKIKMGNEEKTVTDLRKVTVGAICDTYPKEELIAACAMLKIKVDFSKKAEMCKKIKSELIKKEIAARRAGSRVRYFKFYWE